MNILFKPLLGTITTVMMFMIISGCSSPNSTKRKKPTQVVYRFDDHRWLELKGYSCQGALWFVDERRGIRSEVASQFYRIFTKSYINASERYIAVPWWGEAGITVSRDYGRTWESTEIKGREDDESQSDSPEYQNIESLTVVNDQGFLLTRQGHIYMSSLPFDDPRIMPGGAGIEYQVEIRGKMQTHRVGPALPGREKFASKWGLFYVDPRILPELVYERYANFQNLPDKVPEVKNYKGWTHMQCDMDAGL